MGMFDYIRCDYDLPGGEPSFGNTFQTKDLECQLYEYVITADGKLMHGTEPQDFTGEIEFYGSNTTGGWGEVRYTENGEDFESADFTATFHSGVLQGIKEVGRTQGAGIDIRQRPFNPPPSKEEIEQRKRRVAESFVGKTMFLLYGGTPVDEGMFVKVVYENETDLIVEYEKRGHKQTTAAERRLFIDHLLWETKEAAAASHQARIDEHEAEIRRYRKAVEAREQRLARPIP